MSEFEPIFDSFLILILISSTQGLNFYDNQYHQNERERERGRESDFGRIRDVRVRANLDSVLGHVILEGLGM